MNFNNDTDTDNYEHILIEYKNMQNQKKYIIDKLMVEPHINNRYMHSLSSYLFVSEIDTLVEGTYLRWILKNDKQNNYKLSKGAIYCKTIIGNSDNIMCVCKNPFNHTYFHISFDSFYIFRKMTQQELLILYAIQSIDNS
jgi:hypothetical protein